MFSRQSSQVKSVKLSSSWGKNERRRSLQLFSRVIDNFVVVVIVVITFSLSTRMFPFLCPLAPSLHAKSNQGELLNPHHTSNQSMVENGTSGQRRHAKGTSINDVTLLNQKLQMTTKTTTTKSSTIHENN